MKKARQRMGLSRQGQRMVRSKKERLLLRGDWQLTLTGADGKIKAQRDVRNLIVNTGLDLIADFLFGAPATGPSHIAIGTGSTAVAPTDTDLQSQIACEAFDNITPGGIGVISVDTTFAAGTGTGAITECGILNELTAGTLMNRVVFAAVNKTITDTLKCSFSFTITNAA